MSGEYTGGPPQVVAVGSASRDLVATDPRGWRLGGGVTYGALALARLGLRVGALVGVDAESAGAWELDLLREAGVLVRLVRLGRAPVFEHRATPAGREQVCHQRSDRLAIVRLPGAWRAAPGWLFAPVAAELPSAWGAVPPREACVALGWQGLLRRFEGGAVVRRRAPRASPLLARADLVGVSRADLAPGQRLAAMGGWLGVGRPDPGELVLTAGVDGGMAWRVAGGRLRAVRRYPGVAGREAVDDTGAGDVFLATLLAARLASAGRTPRPAPGADLAVAATAASLVVEGPGVVTIPTVAQVASRLRGAP